jgi:hypothetical protein
VASTDADPGPPFFRLTGKGDARGLSRPAWTLSQLWLLVIQSTAERNVRQPRVMDSATAETTQSADDSSKITGFRRWTFRDSHSRSTRKKSRLGWLLIRSPDRVARMFVHPDVIRTRPHDLFVSVRAGVVDAVDAGAYLAPVHSVWPQRNLLYPPTARPHWGPLEKNGEWQRGYHRKTRRDRARRWALLGCDPINGN